MQVLMDTKNSLKTIGESAMGGAQTMGNSSVARAIGTVEQNRFPETEGFRTQLSNELHAAVPEYAAADKTMSDLATAKEAYAEGQNFTERNPQQIQDYLNGVNQPKSDPVVRQQWHKAGAVQRLIDMVTGPYTTPGDIGKSVAQITTDPTVKAALGEQGTAALLPRLQALETKARNATNLLRYAGRGGAAAAPPGAPEIAKGAAASLAMATHVPLSNSIANFLTKRANYMTPNEESAMSRMLAYPDIKELPALLEAQLPKGKYTTIRDAAGNIVDFKARPSLTKGAGNLLYNRGPVAIPQAIGVGTKLGPVNALSAFYGTPNNGDNQ